MRDDEYAEHVGTLEYIPRNLVTQKGRQQQPAGEHMTDTQPMFILNERLSDTKTSRYVNG